MGDLHSTTPDDRPTATLPTLERPLGRLPRTRATAAATGTGLLIGGVLLALYSWFGATTRPVSTTLAQPAQFAAVAGVLGTVVLAIVVAAWFTGRRRRIDLWNSQHAWELRAGGAVVLVLLILVGMSWSRHLPSSFSEIRADYPYFDQLPTAVGAIALVGVGAILALLLTIHMGLARTVSRRILSIAVTAGLAVSTAVAVTAVRAGDDSANIDHLTVAEAPIAPVPGRITAEAYRLQLPPTNERRESTGRQVLAAGTGFVVVSIDGVRAYDGATGGPRWHYLRRPQSGHRVMWPDSGAAFTTADRSVLITRWFAEDTTTRIAFDAVTGRLLWTSEDHNDYTADYPDVARRVISATTATDLLVETDDAVTGYDARTAARRWTVALPTAGCTPDEGKTLASDRAVYRLYRCGESTRRLFAIDTTTGTLVGSRDISTRNSPSASLLENTLRISWYQHEDQGNYYLLVDRADRISTAPIRTAGSPFAADPNGPEVLVAMPEPEGPQHSKYAGMTTTDSIDLRRIPGMTPGYEGIDGDYFYFLADEFVDLNFGGSTHELSIRDRRTLLPTSTIPITNPCRPGLAQPTLMRASSTVLVVCQNNEAIGNATLDIIGFR
ncbi:PQQ-binding-like beta-propeller repeat protein [Nocardia sp. NPDC087230]|uniref:outer membrane protein assembly factor BamB family protein n=1 Tax=Nocardia sp. NPDC087230 TaxID=3364331 RepID=UPI003821EF1A